MTRHLRPRVIRRPTGSPCGPSSFSPVTAFQSWRRRSATGRRSATPRRGESLSLTFLELERRPPRSRRSPTRTAWAAFARWADGEGFQALPAAPAAVAAYLAARSEAGRSLSSLHLARQAIRAAHIEAGEADPGRPPKAFGASSGASRVSGRGRGGRPSGGRAHRRSAGRDPSYRRQPPHRPHQPDGIPRSGPDPGSRGRRPRLRHTGRHAPALRSGRARMGRCRAPAGWIGTAPGPPFEDRPGRGDAYDKLSMGSRHVAAGSSRGLPRDNYKWIDPSQCGRDPRSRPERT